MIFDILCDSLKYTFSNPKNILKLGILELFSVFLIPAFFVSGYQYRIIDHSLSSVIGGDVQMVELNGFKELFFNGIKVYAVKVIYLLIPLLLMFVLNLDFIHGALDFILFAILFVLAFSYGYIAIAHMVKKNSFKKAFNLNEINHIILNQIGLRLIFGVLIGFIVIYSGLGLFLDDFVRFLNLFITADITIFSFSIDLAGIVTMIIFGLFVQPFLHILVARIVGMVYMDFD